MRRLWPALLLVWGCKGNIGLQTSRAYPCTVGSEETKCPAEWRCGLDGRCHSREPGPYLCNREQSGDADCEGDWRCGLNGYCHSPSVPGDYECREDADCVGGWRCGSEGRCVDASSDKLVRTSQPVLLSGGAISPRLLTGYPLLAGGGALRHNGSLYQWVPYVTVGEGGGKELVVADLRLGERRVDGLYRFALGAREPLQVGASDSAVYLRHRTGLTVYPASMSGQGLASPVELTVPGGRLELRARPLIIGESQYAVISDTQVDVFDGPPGAKLIDVDISSYPPLRVAATTWGLFTMFDQDGTGKSGWSPAGLPSLPHKDCDGGVPQLVALDRPFNYDGTASAHDVPTWAEVREPDGGTRFVSYLREHSPTPVPDACGAGGQQHLRELGSCSPCPTGTFVSSRLFSEEDNPRDVELVARCASSTPTGTVEREYRIRADEGPDGGSQCRHGLLPDSFTLGDLPPHLADEARYAKGSDVNAFVLYGKHGQVWVQDEERNIFALEADAPADGLTECAGQPFSFSLLDRAFRQQEEGAGLLATGHFPEDPSQPQPYGTVEGRPCWLVGARSNTVFVGDLSTGGESFQLVASSAPTAQVTPPFHASTGGMADGGTALLVGVGDVLMATELSGPDPGTRKLEVRVSPATRSPILSFATFPSEALLPEDGVVAGYLLTESALTRFNAASFQRWRAEEVTIPDGVWLKVWTEGRAGRVGYANGAVVALPSRTVIAAAAPVLPVHDFAQLCGQTYALAGGGLYRLTPDPGGGPIGQWTLAELPAPMPAEKLVGEGASPRLVLVGQSLYAFDAVGRTFRYTPAGCP